MSDRQVLTSWKEIATYLNRGVRTVQRWEGELGLPIRRPGTGRHVVVASAQDLDRWLSDTFSPISTTGPRKGSDGDEIVRLKGLIETLEQQLEAAVKRLAELEGRSAGDRMVMRSQMAARQGNTPDNTNDAG